MRIFLLANNTVGLEIARFLKDQNEEIVGLAIHNPDKQRFTREIIETLNLPTRSVFLAKDLRSKNTIYRVKKLKPDLLIAAFWGYILKPEFFNIAPLGCINFHPGYLPYNRGMNPNVWPLIEDTPVGVTIHYIDQGIDTGDIIARKKIKISEIDTAATVYDKTLVEIVKLFKKTWPGIKNGTIKGLPQKNLKEQPTFHWSKDIEKTDELVLDRYYKGDEIIRRLKARSYPDRFYSFYKKNGCKIYFRIQMGPIEKDSNVRKSKFEVTIKKRIAIAKRKDHLERIPVFENSKQIAWLKIITSEDAENKSIVNKLALWRSNNQQAYPTQFPVTKKGTKKWVYEGLLNNPTRMLFLLNDMDGNLIGHMGLYTFDFSEKSCEIDNVLRGSSSHPGMITHALNALISWTKKELKIKTIYLRVFEDNEKAIRLYNRCGFEKLKIIPLEKKINGNVTNWVENLNLDPQKSERNFLKMVLK